MSFAELHNIDNCRSYASEDGLMKALKKYGFDTHRHIVVCTRTGRFTAVFPASNVTSNDYGQAGNVMLYAHRGFMTLG